MKKRILLLTHEFTLTGAPKSGLDIFENLKNVGAYSNTPVLQSPREFYS